MTKAMKPLSHTDLVGALDAVSRVAARSPDEIAEQALQTLQAKKMYDYFAEIRTLVKGLRLADIMREVRINCTISGRSERWDGEVAWRFTVAPVNGEGHHIPEEAGDFKSLAHARVIAALVGAPTDAIDALAADEEEWQAAEDELEAPLRALAEQCADLRDALEAFFSEEHDRWAEVRIDGANRFLPKAVPADEMVMP